MDFNKETENRELGYDPIEQYMYDSKETLYAQMNALTWQWLSQILSLGKEIKLINQLSTTVFDENPGEGNILLK